MVSTCNAMSCHVNVIHSHALPFLGKMSGGSADCENDNEDEWYPGKMIGLERQEGEWYPGKMLGRKKNRRAENELIYQEYPLAWKNIDQLTVELSMTDDVRGVLAALEICVNIVNDDIVLTTAVLNAVSRVGKGHVNKMVQLGEGGACEFVVQLLHFFIESYFERKDADPNEQEKFYHCVQTCLVAAVIAIEGLSAGCKRNRHRLARAGTCFYLVEILRRHCREGHSIPLLEATLNTIWQLSFNNKLSKKCFRDCGCENELWILSESHHYSHPIRHRASSILRWLKTQLVEDITEILDPRTLSGALLLSVSDISMTSVKGSASDAITIASESLLALENIMICSPSSSLVQDAIENLFLPATLIIVSRRILRYYKKIFHENKEGLYNFIRCVCSTTCCFLSKKYRVSRRDTRAEDDDNSEKLFDKIVSLLPPPAIKRTASDDEKSYSYCEQSDAIILASPLEKQIISLENKLIAISGQQMKQAGACKLFVKALALFVREEDKQASAPPKKNFRRASKVPSDPLSFFNSAAETFTKGLLSGLQEGVKIFSDKDDSLGVPSSIPFPDGLDGECVETLCDCIKLLCEVSLLTRLHILEENVCGICNGLLLSEYASRAEDLYIYILMRSQKDFQCAKLSVTSIDSISDSQAVVLIFALKVLTQGEILLSSPSKRVQEESVSLLSASLDAVAFSVSSCGILGDRLLREMDGYKIAFDVATHKFLSSHRLAESWLNMCTNIALARIESKEVLGSHGACDICMTVLRVHSLRPKIVQCSLWAICVLIGNHSKNVKRLLSCTSDNWTEYSVKKYLQSLRDNKGQTTEARDHANLICSSISMYETHQISHDNVHEEEHPTKRSGNDCAAQLVNLDLVPLKRTDAEAAEFMHLWRGSNCAVADTINYDLSAFPELNSEPFFRFDIVGVQYNVSTRDSIKGVTEV